MGCFISLSQTKDHGVKIRDHNMIYIQRKEQADGAVLLLLLAAYLGCLWLGFYFLLQKPKVQLNGSKATAVFAQNQFLPSTNLKAPSRSAFAGIWAQKLLTCD